MVGNHRRFKAFKPSMAAVSSMRLLAVRSRRRANRLRDLAAPQHQHSHGNFLISAKL
jgi:hypothetical protein